jgi:hypothetical protein
MDQINFMKDLKIKKNEKSKSLQKPGIKNNIKIHNNSDTIKITIECRPKSKKLKH